MSERESEKVLYQLLDPNLSESDAIAQLKELRAEYAESDTFDSKATEYNLDGVRARRIAGWNHYSVTEDGKVYNSKTRQYIAKKPSGRAKYRMADLHDGERRRQIKVSHLVLEAFGFPRPSPHHIACHNNDNSTDDRLQNLRWGTHADNADDRGQNGLHGGRVITPEKEAQAHRLLEIGTPLPKIADEIGVSPATIYRWNRSKGAYRWDR